MERPRVYQSRRAFQPAPNLAWRPCECPQCPSDAIGSKNLRSTCEPLASSLASESLPRAFELASRLNATDSLNQAHPFSISDFDTKNNLEGIRARVCAAWIVGLILAVRSHGDRAALGSNVQRCRGVLKARYRGDGNVVHQKKPFDARLLKTFPSHVGGRPVVLTPPRSDTIGSIVTNFSSGAERGSGFASQS